MTDRPLVRLTSLVLTGGTMLSAGLLGLGFLLTVAGVGEQAGWVSTAGIVVLLVTPAAGLLTSFIELRGVQPRVALLALVVLGILAAAAILALLAR